MSVSTWEGGVVMGHNKGFFLRDHKGTSSWPNKCTHLKTPDNSVDWMWAFVGQMHKTYYHLYKGVNGEAILDLLLCIHYVLLCRREFWEGKTFYALLTGAFQEVLVMSRTQISGIGKSETRRLRLKAIKE